MKAFAVVAGLVLVLASVGPACALIPQSAPPAMAVDADPTFEVATIKPTPPDEPPHVWVEGTRLSTASTSLVDLMMFAYNVHPSQLVGGPDWIRTEKFDVLVQPNLPGRASTVQMKSVVRKLLAARFQLTTHTEQKQLPVYRIVAAKGGAKLTPTTAESASSNTATIGFAGNTMFVGNASVAELASLMQRYVALDRPVVDKTGILGKFDFKLSWTPDVSQFNGHPPAPMASAQTSGDAPPGLFTAMQEQLGLKLEAAKENVDALVIDRVEHPTDN